MEKIKVHGNLIKRCVKNGPIRIYKRKTILELEKSIRAFETPANQQE